MVKVFWEILVKNKKDKKDIRYFLLRFFFVINYLLFIVIVIADKKREVPGRL